MKFKKILTIGLGSDNVDAKYWDEINKYADKVVYLAKDDPAIDNELGDADGLLTSFGTVVSKDHIDKAPVLKYIGIMATAYGKVDIAYAKQKNILVSNIGGYSTESVAEFIIAAILENIRQLGEGRARALAGNYSEAGMKAIEIKGKTFAVLGLGNIGGRVAEIAQGFGADVRYWSRTRKPEYENRGISYQDLEGLMQEADFISINLAETAETKGVLNKNIIDSFKPGAVIVNTAPMEALDLDALTHRLAKGDITFIFDHADQMKVENLGALKYKNCIAYPPMAYISDEARIAKQKTLIENIKNFLDGHPTLIVN